MKNSPKLSLYYTNFKQEKHERTAEINTDLSIKYKANLKRTAL